MRNFNLALKVVLLAVLLILTSCGTAKMNINDLKAFPKAVEGINYPEFSTRVRTESDLTGLDIEEKIGKHDLRTFSVKEAANLAEVKQFYDTELTDQGFEKENSEPVKSGSSHILYYKKSGFFSSAKVAIVFIEIEDYDSKKIYPFIIHCVSK